MPTAHESVCSAEIGQVWQKVEDQRPGIEMKCITEHPGFLFFFFFFFFFFFLLITYIVLTLLTIQRLILTLLTIRRLIPTLLTIQYNTIQYETIQYNTIPTLSTMLNLHKYKDTLTLHNAITYTITIAIKKTLLTKRKENKHRG